MKNSTAWKRHFMRGQPSLVRPLRRLPARAHRYQVESLEPRVMLDAATPFLASELSSLRSGLLGFAGWVETVETYGQFGSTLPIIGQGVGNAADIGGKIRNNLINPIIAFLDDADSAAAGIQIPTRGQLQTKLTELSGGAATFNDAGGKVEYGFNFAKSSLLAGQSLNLGNNSFGIDITSTFDLSAGVALNGFSFGLLLDANLTPGDAFYVGSGSTLNGSLALDSVGVGVSASANLGMLALTAGGTAESKIKVSAGVGVALTDPTAGDSRITLAELLGTSLVSLVTVTAGTAGGAAKGLDVLLPIKVDGSSFNLGGTIALTDDNLFSGPAPSLDLLSPAAGLTNFSNLSPADLINLVRNLGTALQSFSTNLTPTGGIPFVGETISDAINFAQQLTSFAEKFFEVRLEGESSHTATEAPNFTLTSAAIFQVKLSDQGTFATKTVAAGAYANMAGLLAAINAQLTGTGVVASEEGGRVKFSAVDPAKAPVIKFDADNVGMREIGFVASASTSAPKFTTIQGFISLLDTLLPELNLAEINLQYAPTTGDLKFNFKQALAANKDVHLHLEDDLSLLNFGSLSLTGGVHAKFSVTALLDFRIGINIAPASTGPVTTTTTLGSLNSGSGVKVNSEVFLSGVNAPVSNGVLSSAASFNLALNGGAVVVVTVPIAATNKVVADLLADLNTALNTAGVGALVGARLVAGKFEIFAKTAVTTKIALSVAAATNTAITQLGFSPLMTDGDLRILRRDGVVFDVDLSSLSAASTIQDVITAINTAVGNTGLAKVMVSVNAAGTGLKLVDSTSGAAQFSVFQINRSTAGAGFGILGFGEGGGATSTLNGLALNSVPFNQRVYIEDGAKIEATAALTASPFNLIASLGIIEAGVVGGTLSNFKLKAAATLTDPGTEAQANNRITISEFLSGPTAALTFTLGDGGISPKLSLPLTFSGLEFLGVVAPAAPKVEATLSLAADNSLGYGITVSGMPDFEALASFSTENLIALLQRAVEFIKNSDLALFNTDLPLLDLSIREILMKGDSVVGNILGGAGLDTYLNGIKNLKSTLLTILNGPLTLDDLPDTTINSLWESLQGYGGPAVPSPAAGASFLSALSTSAVEKFSAGIEALNAAVASLPDNILNPALFKLPGKVINAATALKAAIDAVTPDSYATMTAAQKSNFDKFKALVIDMTRAVPSMQKIVDVVFRALGLDGLVDFTALSNGANGIVAKVDVILAQFGTDRAAIADGDAQKAAKQAALDSAITAFTTIKSDLNAVFSGVVDKASLSLLGLLKQFNALTTTAAEKIAALTTAGALTADATTKINAATAFFTEKFPGRFNFTFDGATKVFSGGLQFDLKKSTTLNLDLGITDGIGAIPLSFESGGSVGVEVGANLKLKFGVDGGLLTTDPLAAFFLFPSSEMALTALVDGALIAQVGLGGLSAGLNGTLQLKNEALDGPASLKLGFDTPADQRINFNNSDLIDNFKLTLDGSLKAEAGATIQGVAVPGTLKVEVAKLQELLANFPTIDTSKIQITLPTIDFSAFKLDIFTILQVLEGVLNVAEKGLKTDLMAKMPLVGDSLTDVGSVFGAVKNKVGDLRTALQAINETFSAAALTEFMQILFYQVLGPGGYDFSALPDSVLKAALTAIGSPALNLIKQANGTALTTPTQVAVLVAIDEANNKNLLTDANAKVETQFKFAGSMTWSSSFDLGFNAFNLVSASASGDVQIQIAYDFEIGLGVGKQSGIYLILNDPAEVNATPDLVPPTPTTAHVTPGAIDPEIEFKIDVTLPGGQLQLDVLFLTMVAEDKGSHATGYAYVDLKNKSAPLTEKKVMLTGIADLKPDFTFGAAVDVNFGLTAKIKGDTKNSLPAIKTEFLFGWDWNFQNGGTVTKLKFDDVRLDLGGFISTTIKPILQRVNTFLEPLRPVLDMLELEVPVISQLSQLVGLGTFTFLDGISLLGEGGQTVIKVIGILTEINNFIKQVSSIPGNIFISFGDFDLLGAGGTMSPAGSVAVPAALNPSLSLTQALSNPFKDLSGNVLASDSPEKAKVTGFTSKSSSTASEGLGLAFPILTNPASALKLLLGQDVDLITWDIPRLEAGFEFSQVFGPVLPPFPLFATIGGNFNVFLDLFVGMDTRGIRTKNFLNGFYFGDLNQAGVDVPEAGVSMELYAGAEINAGGIVRAGIQGGISASLTANWNDPNGDGKVYLDEILTNFNRGISCIFDLQGALSAYLRAFLKIEIPLVFTTITLVDESFTIVKVTLLDFNHSCPPLPPPEPGTVINESGENVLYVNIGNRAANRQPGATDGDEEVSIRGEFDANGDGIFAPTLDLNSDGFISEDELREGLDALATGNEGSTTFNGIAGQTLAITGFGQTRIFKNIHRIVAIGGAGDDTIILHPSVSVPARLEGGAGNDVIQGGSGADTIEGGDGDDELSGGAGNDSIIGGQGNDLITGGAGRDTLHGQGGDDTIYGGNNDNKDEGDLGDSIEGGDGNDKIYGHLGDDTITGGAGNDTLFGGAGSDSIDGGSGDDQIFGDEGNDTIVGGIGNDSLYGGKGHDIIVGGGWNTSATADGNDLIFGNSGGDIIIGGNATVTGISRAANGAIIGRTLTFGGGSGNDTLVGGSAGPEAGETDGNDEIYGREGNDLIAGGHASFDANGAIVLIAGGSTGNDSIFGGLGSDTVYGQGGDDFIYGDDGEVILDSQGRPTAFRSLTTGLGGNDRLLGGDGNDLIVGGAGSDSLEGGNDTGKDTLLGDNGGVTLVYSSPGVMTEITTTAPNVGGNDTLLGGAGDDILIGGAGNDSLVGAEGNDIVIGDNGKVVRTAGSGLLVEITTLNFEVGGNDTLFGNDGNDTLLGGSGDDQVSGDLGHDIIFGDNGKISYTAGLVSKIESIEGSVGGKDTLGGASGNDTIIGGANDDSLSGGADHDILLGDNGEIVFSAGIITAIRSTFTAVGGKDTVLGGTGDDTIIGGKNDDSLVGDDGADVLVGDNGEIEVTSGVPSLIRTLAPTDGGDDTILGGNGSDTVLGGTGDDSIQGGADTSSDYLFGDNGRIVLVGGVPTLLESTDPTLGGKDTVYGGGGNDIIVGGSGSKTGSTTTGDNAGHGGDSLFGDAGADIVIGDNASVLRTSTGALQVIRTIFTNSGGDDTIEGNADDDTLLGGFGADSLRGNDGQDIILGDNGELLWVLDASISITAPDGWTGLVPLTTTPGALLVIRSYAPTDGGNDTIMGDTGNDTVIGGTGSDTISGDTGVTAENGSGNDIIFGDHGVLYPTLPTNRNFFSKDTGTSAGGNGDRINGNGGDDTVIAGQGDDTVVGGDGHDTIIGGHNIDGGTRIDLLPNAAPGADAQEGDSIVKGSSDTGDHLEGGRGFDVIAGDNAWIIRVVVGDTKSELYTTDQLFRSLNSDGLLYSDPSGGSFGANITTAAVAEPGKPAGLAARAVVLLDHSKTTDAGRYGNDTIAGGADNDTVFGQLGNDSLHGDGRLDASFSLVNSLTPDGSADRDGNDYIEGNGGSDTIFGGRGQDNILGGSSDLFGLSLLAPDLRPDSYDLIFGGNGTLTGMNSYGDAAPRTGDVFLQDDENVGANGHSRDADVILGDNGRIFRIVAGTSYASFTYDTPTLVATGAKGQPVNANTLGYNNPSGYGSEKIQVRAFELVDYTPGVGGIGGNFGSDRIFGEAGDDTIHGMDGSDTLFGDGQDDDIYGGVGHDWIHGGTGEDGIVGDDGLIKTSRNGLKEDLYGTAVIPTAELNLFIKTPGGIQQSRINVVNQLLKTVDLEPFALATGNGAAATALNARPTVNSDDVIFGGLGNDSLHGGAGDDAISGAEALPVFYNLAQTSALGGTPTNPGNLLQFGTDDPQEFLTYDEYNPLGKITSGFGINGVSYEHLLNFVAQKSNGTALNDGRDKLFGDLGNDWLVGGTNRDNLYGGFGNDLLDTDDDKGTSSGANTTPDERTDFFYADIAFGGGGRDVLIANSAKDRLIDWVGEFNSYLVPFAPYGAWTISRTMQPQLPEYLYALSKSDGADQSRTSAQTQTTAFPGGTLDRNGEPYGELGLVKQQDEFWKAQTGAPDDPQAGNIPGGKRDEWKSESFTSTTQTSFAAESASWSVRQGTYQVTATDGKDATSVMFLENSLPVYFEIESTINTDRPRAGIKANGAIIFDYQNEQDFKFAGIDVSTNKLIIGQRNAAGWQVLSSINIQMAGERDYAVKLFVNGAVATVQLNGAQTVSYTFANKLNQGLVGLGSDNSTSRFDNVRLLVLPPNLTAELSENFDDGIADFFNQRIGAWQVAGGAYTGTPELGSNFAISTFGLAQTPAATTELSALVTIASGTLSGFVFDYQSATNFKYAGYDAATKKLVIGHRAAAGWYVDASFNVDLAVGSNHALSLSIDISTVNVSLNGVKQLSYRFNGFLDDGETGLIAKGATAKFDNVVGRSLSR